MLYVSRVYEEKEDYERKEAKGLDIGLSFLSVSASSTYSLVSFPEKYSFITDVC